MVYAEEKRGVIAPNIIVLIALGIVLLGGATIGIIKLAQQDGGAECPGGVCGAATSTVPFPEPDWAPRTQCGDGVCNPNEKANSSACPQDCAVVAEIPPPTIDSFIATPATVVSGQTATLSWSSTSTFCAAAGDEASWFVTGGAPKGSVDTKPLYIPRTFVLSCMAEDGESIIKSVTVNVTAPPPTPTPTITLRASPESIGKGKTATITWSTTNATACTASGGGTSSGWRGTRPTKGSFTTPALTTRQTYVLVCTGNGRSASRSVTIAVAEGPQVTFTATPSKTTSGEKVTLAWLAPNATSCTASGSGADWGWTAKLPGSGVQTTPPLKESQLFTITCENSVGGSTAKSVQVIVSVPKLSLSLTPAIQFVAYGKQASLRWTSTGATSCTGSGSWVDGGSFGLSDTKLTQPLTAPAILEVTCTGEGGTVTQKATVNVADAARCSFGGAVVPHGTSVTAYQSTSVKYGGECVSQTRTCANGVLSGSYVNASCAVVDAKDCSSTTFGTVKSGASVTAYQSASANIGECVSETRTCTDGTLSGAYVNASCTVRPAKWTTTKSVYCVDKKDAPEGWEGAPTTTACDTGEHAFADLPTESCTSVSRGRQCWYSGWSKKCGDATTETTCYATVTEQYP